MHELNEKIQKLLNQYASIALEEEIEYHLGIDREDGELDLYSILNDIEAAEQDNGSRQFERALRRIFIGLDVYRAMTFDDIQRTTTLGGRKAWCFKLDGKPYRFNKHPEGSRI